MASAPPLDSADLTVPIPWQERIVTTLEPALPYLVLGWLAGVFGLVRMAPGRLGPVAAMETPHDSQSRRRPARDAR